LIPADYVEFNQSLKNEPFLFKVNGSAPNSFSANWKRIDSEHLTKEKKVKLFGQNCQDYSYEPIIFRDSNNRLTYNLYQNPTDSFQVVFHKTIFKAQNEIINNEIIYPAAFSRMEVTIGLCYRVCHTKKVFTILPYIIELNLFNQSIPSVVSRTKQSVVSRTKQFSCHITSHNKPNGLSKNSIIDSPILLTICSICAHPIQQNIALQPCGHTQFCSNCIDKFTKNVCPICMQPYTNYMKIFLDLKSIQPGF